MKVEEVKNKIGETLTTKEGQTLYKLRFEEGDTFIPIFNSVVKRENAYTDEKGQQKVAITYLMKCVAKDKDGNEVEVNGTKEIFVDLTPTQANTLTKKTESGVELNQNLWICYAYNSKEHGKQLGVGLKNNKKPLSFDDLEQ